MKNQTYIIRTDRAGVFFAEVIERNGMSNDNTRPSKDNNDE